MKKYSNNHSTCFLTGAFYISYFNKLWNWKKVNKLKITEKEGKKIWVKLI